MSLEEVLDEELPVYELPIYKHLAKRVLALGLDGMVCCCVVTAIGLLSAFIQGRLSNALTI